MRKIYSILTIVTVVIIVTANINAQISGTVFRDLPVTGLTQNIYGVKDANEPGVEGVTVTVYPGGISTTTAADGTYTIAVSGAVRIEFSGWPSYMKESADGGGSNSSVQFVTAPANNVDFGLYIPASYSDLNIDIMTSVAVSGDPNGGGTSAGEGSVIFHSYTATGDYTSPVGPSIISFGEVGSTFGGAWQSKSKTYFLAAYAKRYVGFKSDPGSVFRINDPAGTPTVSEYFSLDALGFSTGVIPPRTDLPADKGPSHDIDMFGLTGTVSLGDIELDLEQENLYIVNLYDKKLYKVNIGNPAKATITAADVTSFAIPDPGCTNGNWRPFALGLDEARNVLMIGGVCDAAFGDRSDLHAYLYEFDLNTQTMAVSSVLDFALDFQRGDTWGSHPVPPITNHWNIWSDEPSDWLNAAIPSISVLRTHPEPLLADIEFETDGSMILGFRDIWGDRFGAYNYAPEQSNTNAYSCHANGDLYKVKKIAGVYELENNGGFSDGSSGCGVGNGDGPGGGEFYCDDDYSSHANVPQGGLAYLMGEEHFVAESMDPHTVDSGGSRWMSNTPGNSTQGYQYYKTNDGSSGTFAKASGTGDVELLLDPAPIEIGNLVWEDTDGDGVQDPGELGISGVTVELKQGGTTIATAITDANGNYIFSNDPNGTTTASHIYNITQLVPGMDYTLTVPTTSGSNSLTTKDSGEGANPDLNDSDADTGTGEIQVLASSIPVTGANNHSFDIGYMLDGDEYCLDYRFEDCDGNATTVEYNGSGLDGTLVNGAEIKLNEGKIDHGLYTDGTGSGGSAGSSTYQMMLIPNDPKTQIVADLTIALWVKPDAIGDRMGLVTKDGHDHEFWFSISESGQLLYYHGDVTALISDSSISAGQWTHIAVVRDAVNKLIYFFINGVQDGAGKSYAGMDDPVISTEPVAVGACPPCWYPYKGYMDELKICNYAYSSAQMSNLYNMQNQGKNEDGTDRCPSSCDLNNTGKDNESCNDNNTGSDSSDDYITFDLNPTGSDLGTTYNVSVNNGGTVTPASGTYGSATSFRLQNGSADGVTTYTITIADVDDPNCNLTTTVQQNSCSNACSLTDAGKNNETCNNAGTSGDESDDYISFDLDPTGLNISAGYTVTVDNGGTITPTSGTYGSATSFQLQNGSADGTTYTITITDNADANCTITTTVNQNSCSTCTTSATFTTDCDDNGTLPNENDDYFNLIVTGTVTDGTGNYVVKIGTYTSAATASGASVTITGDGQGGNPMLAADGSSTYTVRIEDANDSTCFTEYTVGPVDECSECPTPDCLNVQVKKNN